MIKKNQRPEHYFSVYPKSEARFGLIRTCFRHIPFEFLTASGVFSRKRIDSGTRLLIESMALPKNGLVLDVGCGYGAVGIAAATFNQNLCVIMVDVNNRAVRLARHNIEINHLKNVEARWGSLYEPVKDLVFTCILANPPLSAGMETIKAIVTEAPSIMANKALFQMVVKSKIGGKRLQIFLKNFFGNVAILARKSGYRVLIAIKEENLFT